MGKSPAPSPQRIAVDTNFVLNCYKEDETALVAWETFMARVPRPVWVIPPTVSQELLGLHDRAKTAAERAFFQGAAISAVEDRCFNPMSLAAVRNGIAQIVADKLRRSGVVPEYERNDSLILAEASLLSCVILVSSDSHLADADKAEVSRILASSDCDPVTIVHPFTIANAWKGKRPQIHL